MRRTTGVLGGEGGGGGREEGCVNEGSARHGDSGCAGVPSCEVKVDMHIYDG